MSRPGRVRALAQSIAEARRIISAQSLIIGDELREMRELGLYRAYGHRSLTSLIGAELPELDPRQGRSALELSETFADIDRILLMHIGPAKLRLIAELDTDADRQLLIASAADAPYAELRGQLEDLRRARTSELAREQISAPPPRHNSMRTAPEARAAALSDEERRSMAEESLRRLRLALIEQGVRYWELGGLLAEMRDERLWRDLGMSSFEALLSSEDVDISRSEAYRLLRVVETMAGLSPRRRARLGFAKLALIAPLRNGDRRARLIEIAEEPGLSFHQLREHVREAEAAAATERATATARSLAAEEGIAASEQIYVDDRARLSPFNVIFLSSEEEPRFHDATDRQLIEQLILRYSRPGERIVDLTAGIGSVAEEARRMHRRAVSYDIIDPPMRPDIHLADALGENDAEEPGSIDLVFFHPPLPDGFGHTSTYGQGSTRHDLSLMDYPAYIEACGMAMSEAERILRNEGVLVVICREWRRHDGRYYDTPAHLQVVGRRVGLVFHDKLITLSAPGRRAAQMRSEGFRAGRANNTINITTTALVFCRQEIVGD